MDFGELTAEEQQPFIDKAVEFLTENDLFFDAHRVWDDIERTYKNKELANNLACEYFSWVSLAVLKTNGMKG